MLYTTRGVTSSIKSNHANNWSQDLSACLPTFPTRSMFGPHTNVWQRLFIPPFTYTTLPTGLLQIYIYSECGHTEMRCQGHHCHFNCLSIYICTMADAAIVLKCSVFTHCCSGWPFDLFTPDSRKRFIDPIKLSPLQLLLRPMRRSWLVAT